MNNFLDSIKQNYEYLVPTKNKATVLLLLNERISNEEISKNFTYQNIKRAVKEALSLKEESNRKTQDILINLLYYFIERPGDMSDRYRLTDYAHRFIGLLENKVSNKYRNFPLESSFEQYASFQSKNIKTIEEFQEWFEFGFSITYKEKILSHIESLKDEVRDYINHLTSVLYGEEKDALTIVNEFKNIFNNLEDKAGDIQNATQTDIQLDIEIGKLVDKFYERLENIEFVEANPNLDKLTQDWQQSVLIQKEVKQFFREIKDKLSQLRGKIVFASSKLNELPEHFKYQTKVKRNLRKLLEFTLQNSRYSSGDIILPQKFPAKYIVHEEFKLYNLSKSDSFFKQQSKIIEPVIDREYELQEREKIDLELLQQEKAANWIKKCKQILRSQKQLDFTEKFYEILKEENNVNIPIQVGYKLFEYASHSTEYLVVIDRNIIEQYSKEEVIIWQMNIIQKV